jgi:5-methylcytosine-specific restriction protein B
MNPKFSWVKTHQELSGYLLTKRNQQEELITLLKSVGIEEGFRDRTKNGEMIDLVEIDPFTFYRFIYKYGEKKRLKFLQAIARKLNIYVPEGDSGIPTAQAQKLFMFPYLERRVNNEINKLWDLFEATFNDSVNNDLFQDVLDIISVGPANITEVLFYTDPTNYLPINAPVQLYISEVLDINPKFNSYSEYLDIINKVKKQVDKPLYEISYDAFLLKGQFDKSILNDFENWLAHSYESNRKNKLGTPSVKTYLNNFQRILIDLVDKDFLGRKHFFAIKNEKKLIEIRDAYLSVPEIKSKNDRSNGSISTPLNLYIKYINDGSKTKDKETDNTTKTIIMNDSSYAMNTILYGPPGTGKTYNSINHAVAIIEGKSLKAVTVDDYDDVMRRYKKYVSNGRIDFTTFHQSMSYEDFIEGIKPVMNDESDIVNYEIRDGIFKKLCVESKFAMFNVDEGASELLSFDSRYGMLVDKIIESEKPIEIELKTGNVIDIVSVSDKGNLEVKHRGGSRSYIVSKQRLEKVFIDLDDFENLPNLNKAIRDIIGGSNASAYWAVNKYLHELSDVDSSSDEMIFTYEQKKKAFPHASNNDRTDPENYVLIIDEINRGNIAQIFGELITLLEPNKRAGEKEALETILPYSQEKFSVPNNLYIIGTMNTADRSVEALDTALRRRFSFKEMAPKPYLIKEINKNYKGEVDLVKMLIAINARIEVLLDKDHCIGHSYFLKVTNDDDLKSVFGDKVIPLLEEYFFGDIGKIGMVLGQSFVEESRTAIDVSLKTIDGIDYSSIEDYADRKIFNITTDNWNFEDIYA